jgi:hypothetical protein
VTPGIALIASRSSVLNTHDHSLFAWALSRSGNRRSIWSILSGTTSKTNEPLGSRLAIAAMSFMYLLASEVREQPLGGDQHRLRGSSRSSQTLSSADPAWLRCLGPSGSSLLPQFQRLRKINGDPLHTAVVQAPELGFQAFA